MGVDVVSGGTRKRPILALNCGSSSLKFGLYAADAEAAELLCEGEAEEIGRDAGRFWFKSGDEPAENEAQRFADHGAAFGHAFEVLQRRAFPAPEAVGHRFVHGGPCVREHTKLTREVLAQLQAAVPYAPLHVPPALSVLQAVQQKLRDAPQVICLDTAFHRYMPEVSRVFALPYELREQGVERYGFHGLSLESILPQLAPLPERLVIAHLGNGSSITAVWRGTSVDTTMGLTPTGGVMMGSRCGDLDPGVLIYLLRHGDATADELERLVDQRSGLLGVSGLSNDVRELMEARKGECQADLALQMFGYQVRKAIASMAAAMGGVDGLVFTGGIGEHAAELREEICSGLAFLGLKPEQIQVRPAREDEQIAKITARLSGA